MFLLYKNSCQWGRPPGPLEERGKETMARPRLGDEERRTRTVGVRVTEAEAEELQAQAARLSRGAYLRRRI